MAYVYFYDQRGGGVETAFKEDKDGLGLCRRSKKRFAAQQMVVYLNTMAHNVLHWARNWLIPQFPPGTIAVSESGICTAADAARARAAGAHAILVGEALMKAPDPARLMAEFRGEPHAK